MRRVSRHCLFDEPRAESGESKAKAVAAGDMSEPSALAGGLNVDNSNDEIQTVTDAEDLVGEDAKLGMVAARVSEVRFQF